jgi:hypothetical protein
VLLLLHQALLACGVYGTSAVTGLTAQNTRGVQRVWATPLDMLGAQVLLDVDGWVGGGIMGAGGSDASGRGG